eukprot:CAMPEP_0194556350 /NCGR_PEP_ID=MMETSP0253-20130528/98699_1 /TAXON_ID=2966 /ORGANISM="Noctiluca scintillans" /LENGTH=74 /DNA_ID=CAMNT_0039403853 /DNA_START=377 /DNA_END=601 /DNA_ORIENTATION=-
MGHDAEEREPISVVISLSPSEAEQEEVNGHECEQQPPMMVDVITLRDSVMEWQIARECRRAHKVSPVEATNAVS